MVESRNRWEKTISLHRAASGVDRLQCSRRKIIRTSRSRPLPTCLHLTMPCVAGCVKTQRRCGDTTGRLDFLCCDLNLRALRRWRWTSGFPSSKGFDGKGKAKGKGKCNDGKGKGKGKKGEKGKEQKQPDKNGHFQGYCGYCEKWRHKRTDCRNGAASSVDNDGGRPQPSGSGPRSAVEPSPTGKDLEDLRPPSPPQLPIKKFRSTHPPPPPWNVLGSMADTPSSIDPRCPAYVASSLCTGWSPRERGSLSRRRRHSTDESQGHPSSDSAALADPWLTDTELHQTTLRRDAHHHPEERV